MNPTYYRTGNVTPIRFVSEHKNAQGESILRPGPNVLKTEKAIPVSQVLGVAFKNLSDEDTQRIDIDKLFVNKKNFVVSGKIVHEGLTAVGDEFVLHLFVRGSRQIYTHVGLNVEMMSTTPRAETIVWPLKNKA